MKKAILILCCIAGCLANRIHAQEARLQAQMLILGYVNDPFIGAGAGLEAGLGEHTTLNIDANWGSQKNGTAWEFRPGVNYYFNTEKKGFFVGLNGKYIHLKEDEDSTVDWENNLYAIGINLGAKAMLSESLAMVLTINPHKTVGGTKEGDVAGISTQLGLGYRF